MLYATATAASTNEKLGHAAATLAAQVSCPVSCRFRDGGGCYAETGRFGKFVTGRLNDAADRHGATARRVALAEAAAIDELDVAPGTPMRLHTVGDCPTDETAVIVAAAAARYQARGGGPVWTYTHAWRDVDRSSWGTVSVLASCETAEDVAAARARGYAPSIVVEEFQSHRLYQHRQPEGEAPPRHDEEDQGRVSGSLIPLLPCPAQTRDRTCSSCRLCFNDQALLDRGYAIGFELHGIPLAVRQARLALRHPDDPDRRVPSEERIRRIRDRHLADHGAEPTISDVQAAIPDLNRTSISQWLAYLRGDSVHPAERRRRARAAA